MDSKIEIIKSFWAKFYFDKWAQNEIEIWLISPGMQGYKEEKQSQFSLCSQFHHDQSQCIICWNVSVVNYSCVTKIFWHRLSREIHWERCWERVRCTYHQEHRHATNIVNHAIEPRYLPHFFIIYSSQFSKIAFTSYQILFTANYPKHERRKSVAKEFLSWVVTISSRMYFS